MVNVNIKDEDFEVLVKDFIGKQATDYCKKVVEETFTDEVVSNIKTLAIRRVSNRVEDYEIKVMFRKAVEEQVKEIVRNIAGDINEDIRKMIDESVKQNLSSGRVEAFVFRAVKDEIHQYVEKAFKDFHGEAEE